MTAVYFDVMRDIVVHILRYTAYVYPRNIEKN